MAYDDTSILMHDVTRRRALRLVAGAGASLALASLARPRGNGCGFALPLSSGMEFGIDGYACGTIIDFVTLQDTGGGATLDKTTVPTW